MPSTFLFILIFAAFAAAQSVAQLSIGSVSTLNSTTVPNPPVLDLPSAEQLWLTVALCTNGSPPKFFVLNGTEEVEIKLQDGNGNWTGSTAEGVSLRIENAGADVFEVGVSDIGPLHEVLAEYASLGDTSANQAIIQSPSFLSVPKPQSSYPNYTLPAANTSWPEVPATTGNFTLVIRTSPLDNLPWTACGMRTGRSPGGSLNETSWLRDETTWRRQWLIGGLSPLTNYTAVLIQNDTKITLPMRFVTKSPLFACSLAYNIPFCPSVNYAVPMAQPPFSAPAWDATNLPTEITAPFVEYMTNFTTTLTTFACGRDQYSPLQSCADCQRAYRKWLCAITFPRCAEPAPSTSEDSPVPALVNRPTTAPPRNPAMPPLGSAYTELLPCLETCLEVDRACPFFLGFRCPVVKFNAKDTYGVGYIDTGEEGVEGGGSTGVAQDEWGNVWCNKP